MNKPNSIKANYISSQYFNLTEILDDLNLSWDDIESYKVENKYLTLTTNKGDTHKVYREPSIVDYKQPFNIEEL